MTNPLETHTLAQLRQRQSMKWRRYPEDVLPLWVAEMDVSLAPAIVEAVSDAMRRGDTGYPGGNDYAEAMAEFAMKRWGWSFDIGQSAIVPDVMMGIVEVLKLITGPGDAVVINSPVYTPFYQFITNADRRVVEAPLGADYRIDFEFLEHAFGQVKSAGRPAAYLLCSPHNPVGTVHTEDELVAVAELASRYDVRVIVDEIHAPLVHEGSTHLPFLSLQGTGNAIALLSASKGWNLAGLKAAVAVAGHAAVADLDRMPEEVSHGPSHIGIIGHCAALRDGQPWLDDLLVGLEANRRHLAGLLTELIPEVRCRQPEGTYLAWLDCRALDLPADPAEVFLRRGRVALVSGPAFGTGGEGHVRMNIATSQGILEEAVRRMASAL